MSDERIARMLSTNIAGIKMRTPLIGASGTFGNGEEYDDFVDWQKVGGISGKGLTLEPRRGNPGQRVVETASGMLNCVGLQNPGIDVFVKETLPRIKKYNTPIIVNINGNCVEDYIQIAEILAEHDVGGIEVNISCPNTKHGCMAFGVSAEAAATVTHEVKKRSKAPIIVKLSPNVTDIVEIAKAVEAVGADSISLINTLLGMAVDTKTWRPMLGNITGGLSGPAVKPIALRMVWQVAQAVKIPVIGLGGICTATDVVEFMLVGATAVQVGTANFINPQIMNEIADGLCDYLEERNIKHISEIVGQVRM